MADKGSISEKPVTEIFREMVKAGKSGILRVQTDRHIRIVVFEDGRPVFGISNVPGDQLDVLLVRGRRLTPDQAKTVKQQITKEQEFGPKLVELGICDAATVESAMYDQVCRIVQNAMLTFDGEYSLDFSQRVNHDVTIDAPLDQWLLDTARNASPETARRVLGAPETRFVATGATVGEMSPLDGFLLSRITAPMTVDEIHTLSGLSEEQSIPTIYALLASGLIASEGGSGFADSGPLVEPAAQQSVEEIRDDLDRMLGSFVGVEYYDVLQIPRRSDSAEVKKAYYALAKRFHPDRYQHTNDQEIRDKLEAIFAHVSKAYDTLKDETARGLRSAHWSRRGDTGALRPAKANRSAHVVGGASPRIAFREYFRGIGSDLNTARGGDITTGQFRDRGSGGSSDDAAVADDGIARTRRESAEARRAELPRGHEEIRGTRPHGRHCPVARGCPPVALDRDVSLSVGNGAGDESAVVEGS
ncbi:MAG: DnaJ domain-containing protein [Blastocatellia bacterium]|nr:DnaJ domain-containing protein [Blastocatellia bacterium]